MIVEYLICPMQSFILWDTQMNNTNLIYTHTLTGDKETVTIEARGCKGSTMPVLWEHKGGMPNSSCLGLEAFVGGSHQREF